MASAAQFAQFFPSQDPNQQSAILDIQRRQALASALAQNGQMPDPNEAAPAVGPFQQTVKHSPLEYLVRGLSLGIAGQETQKANKEALQLRAQQLGTIMGGGGQSADGNGAGIDPNILRKGMMLNALSPGLGDKYMGSAVTPTDTQKDAGFATGGNSPAQNLAYGGMVNKAGGMLGNGQGGVVSAPGYGTANALNVLPQKAGEAAIGAATTPQTLVSPKGVATTGTVLGNLPGGAASIPFYPGQNATSQAPLAGASTPPAVMPNGANPGMSLPGANAPIPGLGGTTGAQIPPVPPSALGAPQVASPGAPVAPAGVGIPVQGPAAASGLKTDMDNAANYKNELIKNVAEGEKSVKIINAQESLLPQFKSGAWTTNKADLAAKLSAIGAPDSLVKQVAGGDPAAVQAFEGMRATHALTQLSSLLQGQRMNKTEYSQLSADLANPDKMAGAIKTINNLQRDMYGQQADELGAMSKWEDQGQPLNRFRESYSAQRQTQLGKETAALKAPSGQEVKTINGQNFVKIDGKWYHQ